MDIYTEPGGRVRYLAENGFDIELERANEFLTKDELYTVDLIHVGGYSSRVSLRGISGTWNTVMFENVNDEGWDG